MAVFAANADPVMVPMLTALSDESWDSWWNPLFGDQESQTLWDGDWWLAPSKRNEVADLGRVSNALDTFDPGNWETKYVNGRIPQAALTRVGQEASGAPALFRPDAAVAWRAMVRAAARDGVSLTITDSYRNFQQQVDIEHRKPLLAATPGTSNHGWGIAVDVGEGEQRTWMAENAARFGWHVLSGEPWHFDYEGDGKEVPNPRVEIDEIRRFRTEKPKPVPFAQSAQQLIPAVVGKSENLVAYGVPSVESGVHNPADAIFGMYIQQRAQARGHDDAPPFGGSHAAIKRQLYQGFKDAGREDLARMVRTKDFEVWLTAENGSWDPSLVSRFYPGHGRNAGLFQFALLDRDWVWNDVDRSGWTYGSTAYQQALNVVKYFPHLTPAKIRAYADQVRSGNYGGWG